MNFLLSTAALLAGPFVYALGLRNAVAHRIFDSLIVIAIAWIIGAHILPDAFAAAGVLALVFVGFGMLLPLALRRIFHLASRTAHIALLMLAALALALHAVIDGVALLPATGDNLALAVILHRLPVGMAIWWTFRPALGPVAAIAAFVLIIGATGVAWLIGGPVIELVESSELALFQAFVSGSLIDLVIMGIRDRLKARAERAQ